MPVACSHLERLQLRKMLQCVRDSNEEQLAKIVLHGVPNIINYNDPEVGITPLIMAVQENNIHMLKVSHKSHVNKTHLAFATTWRKYRNC